MPRAGVLLATPNLIKMENFKKLSRAEMKNVVGGYDHPVCSGKSCKSDTECGTKCSCVTLDFGDSTPKSYCLEA